MRSFVFGWFARLTYLEWARKVAREAVSRLTRVEAWAVRLKVGMRRVRMWVSALALAVVAVSLANAPTSASHPARGRTATTQGVIVWSQQSIDGSAQHLMIARADGSHQLELTPVTPDAFDIDAQVSPNGRWIAYEREVPVATLSGLCVQVAPATTSWTSAASIRAAA